MVDDLEERGAHVEVWAATTRQLQQADDVADEADNTEDHHDAGGDLRRIHESLDSLNEDKPRALRAVDRMVSELWTDRPQSSRGIIGRPQCGGVLWP